MEIQNIVIYAAFLIFYIVCFCFMYLPNSELVSLSVLFIMTAIFLAYNINNAAYFFYSYVTETNFNISMLAVLSGFFGLIMHFIGLLLINTTTVYLQSIYSDKTGNPLYLSQKYKVILSDFKEMFMVVFGLCFALLFTFFYNEELIKRKPLSLELTICVLIVSILIGVHSYLQFNRANEYAKLRQKNYLDPPNNSGSNQYIVHYSEKPVITTAKPKPKETEKPTDNTSVVTTTPTATTILDMETDFSNNVFRLYDPAVKANGGHISYYDFCSLRPNDYNSLISDSYISKPNPNYPMMAKFDRYKKACSQYYANDSIIGNGNLTNKYSAVKAKLDASYSEMGNTFNNAYSGFSQQVQSYNN